MHKTLIWCSSTVICLLALFSITFACGSQQGDISSNHVTFTSAVVSAPEVFTIAPEPEIEVESADQARFSELHGYVFDAMNAAVKPDQYSVSYDDVSRDIVTVVLDPNEPPIWRNDKTKARTNIMMVSIAYHETNFRAYVDDGRCNSTKWRNSDEGVKFMKISGNCDGGIAHSMWQVHTGLGGIVTVPVDYDSNPSDRREWCYSYQCTSHDGTLVAPVEMTTNRQAAIRVALHMIRRSVRNNVGLCQFTGEKGSSCPKGEVRYSWAEEYSKKHPFVSYK